jgi:hypothetical protein
MAVTAVEVTTAEEPAWAAFERQCWNTARDSFIKGVKDDDKKDATDFIASKATLAEARSDCKDVDRQAGARYSTEKSHSFSVGGKRIVPKAIMIKLLQNLDTFTTMGDVAVKGGPESVLAIFIRLQVCRLIECRLVSFGWDSRWP